MSIYCVVVDFSVNLCASSIEKITKGENLEAKYRDHQLIGAYQGARECHIEPDWLLIYEITENEVILIRTGSHLDLFG